MNYILFDQYRDQLLPFTHTRPVSDIRCGILTMRERWELCLGKQTGTLTEGYLQPLFPVNSSEESVYVNGAVAGTSQILAGIDELNRGDKLVKGNVVIAARPGITARSIAELEESILSLQPLHFDGDTFVLQHVWDIFAHNDRAIKTDFKLVTADRRSAPIPGHVTVTGREQIFIEKGAVINAGCVINAATGPVYIGKDAEIWEGCMIRGPLALCEHGVIKMGAKIYGPTTIGPGCKVGGEVSNVVFFANSNKGHDGFLGNSVVGEWCNLGADTNSSNLKNNYDEVKIWDESTGGLVKTGLTFCGLLMGDHSKCGINTMFNTGTVVGVSCNIFGGGFPEKYIPSFSWGGSDGLVTYEFDRAMETASRMMGRRGKQLSAQEKEMYHYLFREATKRS